MIPVRPQPDPLAGATYQALIDLLPRSSGVTGTKAFGGVVTFPAGEIVLDKPLMLAPFVTLRGQATGTLLRTRYTGPAIVRMTHNDNWQGDGHAVEDMQIACTGGTAIGVDASIRNAELPSFRNLHIFGGGIDLIMPGSADNITFQPLFERVRFYGWKDYCIRGAPRMARFVQVKCNGQTQTTPAIDLDGFALNGSFQECWHEGTAGPLIRITGQFSRFSWNAGQWNEQHWSDAKMPQVILEGGAMLVADWIVMRDTAPAFLRGDSSSVTGVNVLAMDANGNPVDHAKAYVVN